MKFFLEALEEALKDMMGEGFKSQARLIGEKMAEILIKQDPDFTKLKNADFIKTITKIWDLLEKEGLLEKEETKGNVHEVRCVVHSIKPEEAGKHVLCYIVRGFFDALFRRSNINLELKVKSSKDKCEYSIGDISFEA